MTQTENSFNALDRCDACGAQAWVKAQLDTGELFFCAHHARAFKAQLDKANAQLVDETARLKEEEKLKAPLTAMQ